MRKTLFIALMAVMASLTAYAKAGAGSDGIFFILSVAVLALVTAALLKGTDLIIRNRKKILPMVQQQQKQAAAWLRRHFANRLWRYSNSPT